MTVRIAVLASGRGSNLQALIDHFSRLGEDSPATIELVASNRAAAPALDRARSARITAESFDSGDDGSALIALLERHSIDLIVLAGYMKHVPPSVIARWNNRMINVHPGLLPEFGGAGMYGARVHKAVIDRNAPVTGVTVHLVDEEFDHGPVVAQWRIPVLPGESAESLADRVLEVEHIVYPRTVEMVATLIGRKFSADL
jgi:formyltetrahydrofolate-dependent phosphoribosylglycinamide formyltransferase